jgi:hypothetical protein
MKFSSLAPVGLLAALLPLQSVQAQDEVYSSPHYSLGFNVYSTATGGSWPKSTAVGDFTGDGFADVAVGDKTDKNIRVFANQQDGTFAELAGQLPIPLGGSPYYMRAADMDGDGWSDLVAVDVFAKKVLVFRNQGGYFTNSYNNSVMYPAPSQWAYMRVDTTRNSSLNNVHGGFSEKVIALALADLNRDGKLDIVASHLEDDTVFAFFNSSTPGSLSFAEATVNGVAQRIELPARSTPWALQAADINKDGRSDIAMNLTNGATLGTSTQAPNDVDGSLKVLFGCDSSSMRLCVDSNSTPLQYWPYELAARDMNGDFRPDLMVVNTVENTLSMLRNTTPTGAMTASFAVTTYYVGKEPKSLAVADFNGDCLQDVIVSNHLSETFSIPPSMSVLLNTPGAAGTFWQEEITSVPYLDRGVAMTQANLNNDNMMDVLLVGATSKNIISMLNFAPACY